MNYCEVETHLPIPCDDPFCDLDTHWEACGQPAGEKINGVWYCETCSSNHWPNGWPEDHAA